MRSLGFFGRVFGGTVAVILITAFGVYFAAFPTIETSLELEAERKVELEASWAARLCEQSFDLPSEKFDTSIFLLIPGSAVGSRFTLVAPDGRVLFDSQRLPEEMDNHSERAEIRTPGVAVSRFSRTLQKDLTYFALPVIVDNELRGYARVSIPVENREARLGVFRAAIQNGALLAGLISLLLAWYFARRVTQPLSEISQLVTEIGANATARRLHVRSNDEVGLLANAVNDMADDLQKKGARVERDRAERDAIFTALEAGLLAVDKEQRVLFVNQQGRSLLGSLQGNLKGKPVWELTRNRSLIEVIEDCLAREVRVTGESRMSNDGVERIVEVTAVPMDGDAGARPGCVLELRDVSELRRLEEVRRDFVTNVSHELKTPLTAMQGYTEALLEDVEMPASMQRSFLEKAHKNTERLVAIISDLLSLSRLESEEHELAFEPLQASALVVDVFDDFRDLAGSRQMKLSLAGPDAEPRIRADAQALRMAISNLVSNAIQYSPDGGEVLVEVEALNGELRLDIRDQGPGIPEHEQGRVFERFYRLDKARSRKLGGTGLGLAIVRHVMSSHGGRVELESELGRGSCFSLFLPVV